MKVWKVRVMSLFGHCIDWRKSSQFRETGVQPGKKQRMEKVVEFAAMPYFSAGKVSAPVLRLLSLGMTLLCLPRSAFIWIWRTAKTLIIGGWPELQLWFKRTPLIGRWFLTLKLLAGFSMLKALFGRNLQKKVTRCSR